MYVACVRFLGIVAIKYFHDRTYKVGMRIQIYDSYRLYLRVAATRSYVSNLKAGTKEKRLPITFETLLIRAKICLA